MAPFQPGTAAGRFLDKTGGRGGYMAIFCCDDPDARGKHAEQIGVRIANVIGHAPYRGVQLHPRDCRAAFIEFNHTDGSDDIFGPYPPAGPDWQKSIRQGRDAGADRRRDAKPGTAGLGRALGQDHRDSGQQKAAGEPELKLPNASFRFVKGEAEIMSGLTFKVGDVARVLDAAKAKGLSRVGRFVRPRAA